MPIRLQQYPVFEDALHGTPRPVPLTAAEVAVMEYVVQGYNNHQIAAILGNTPGTISRHVMAARQKLKVQGVSREWLIATYLATRET